MALKQKMFASWALLKRQYGRLQCLSSVGLMFRLCTTVVQSTACYGCEVWGAATFAAKEREDLMKGYLQILREITGVRTSTPTAILLAELGLQALSDEWLLRAAKFWNNLAALPPDNIHRCMALDSCKSAIGPRNRRKNWAGSMYRAIIDTGYQLAIRLDDDTRRISQGSRKTEEGVESELAFRTETSCTACTTAYAICPSGYAGLLDSNGAPAELLKNNNDIN